MPDELPEISREELHQRVLYSVLRAASVLTRLFRPPLKQVVHWLETACFHELRDAGYTQGDAAEHFGVSKRKIAQLASRLKQNFFRPERHGGLPRRIEFMLWAGPMSEGRIRQAVDEATDEEVGEALDQLVAEERVIRKDGRTPRYEVPRDEFRLYRDDWIARIDGLNNHLESVIDSVVARFFGNDDRAFARTLNFRIRTEDLDELEALYEEVIFPTLARLEKKTDEVPDDEATEMSLSINWAPYRYSEKFTDHEDEDN